MCFHYERVPSVELFVLDGAEGRRPHFGLGELLCEEVVLAKIEEDEFDQTVGRVGGINGDELVLGEGGSPDCVHVGHLADDFIVVWLLFISTRYLRKSQVAFESARWLASEVAHLCWDQLKCIAECVEDDEVIRLCHGAEEGIIEYPLEADDSLTDVPQDGKGL